jgi:hypothetical protein
MDTIFFSEMLASTDESTRGQNPEEQHHSLYLARPFTCLVPSLNGTLLRISVREGTGPCSHTLTVSQTSCSYFQNLLLICLPEHASISGVGSRQCSKWRPPGLSATTAAMARDWSALWPSVYRVAALTHVLTQSFRMKQLNSYYIESRH